MPYVNSTRILAQGQDWKVEERVNGQGLVDIVISDDSGAEVRIYRRNEQFKLEVSGTLNLGMFQSRPVYVIDSGKKSGRH